ncbi:MAG TPA: insulinase family protein, partial [Brevundimonas sp.]|nr:insulinase family protein [Brevundimonas sp.]
QLDAWVDDYFAPLKRPSTPMPVNDVKEPEPTGPRTATFYAPNVPLPAVALAWNTVAYKDADRAALTVLDGILSTGESAASTAPWSMSSRSPPRPAPAPTSPSRPET